ncbi:unnamed protein product [Pedinophyceae sp. YPF-701]|nr:unnamed protein product [Pedinophyceae sp. YPF-701]
MSANRPIKILGKLNVTVMEVNAWKDGRYKWGATEDEQPDDKVPTSCFVKLELKSKSKDPAGDTKSRTRIVETSNGKAFLRETLPMEVREGAEELRVIVCRSVKAPDGTQKHSVIAACGLYIKDVIAVAPIDKYFDLYKPHKGGPGGMIRVKMDFRAATNASDAVGDTGPTMTPAEGVSTGGKKKGGPVKMLMKLVLLGGVAAGAALGVQKLRK